MKNTKKRIGSVKNTQKITRAMKLVSSAKYARANALFLKSKPYSASLDKVFEEILRDSYELESAFLKKRQVKNVGVVVVTSDRGLCGGLNANVLKKAEVFIESLRAKNIGASLFLWGKRSFLLEKKTTFFQINKEMKVLESGPQGWHKLAKQCLSLFNQNVFDELYFIYPNFINALVQQPSIEKVLPMDMAEQTLLNEKKTPSSGFIYEPNKKSVIDSFLQARYENSLVRILLSSVVSEHAARMTAMDNATNNANKVIKDLTLQYNRARQAAITKELIEITSGAEAI